MNQRYKMQLIDSIIEEIKTSKLPMFTADEVIKIINNVAENDPNRLYCDDVVVDLSSYHIEVDGKKIKLPRKVLQMAYYLLDNKTKVVTREKLLLAVWGDDVIVGPRTVDVHIRKLRAALNDKYIKTIKGIGYQWKN